MPLADRIRDLGVGIAFLRINLDGLVPPAPALAPAKREPDAALSAASLTVEEARKMLRATQMEAAHARIRESGVGAVPYARLPAPLLRRRRPGRGPLRRARARRVRILSLLHLGFARVATPPSPHEPPHHLGPRRRYPLPPPPRLRAAAGSCSRLPPFP
uniref:Uncharacterized protein n=1 Tax=Zea mays TaxID=4577 RepID=A0A804UJ85_MAIZE